MLKRKLSHSHFTATQRNARSAFSMTRAYCNTCNEEFLYDEWNLHTCSNIPAADSFQCMICTDVRLMKSLISPLKRVLPINAGEGFIHRLSRSFIWGCSHTEQEVVGGGGRWWMGCLKTLGVQYTVIGHMWGWNNKVLDLETPLGGHENFLPAQNAQSEACLYYIYWISMYKRRGHICLAESESMKVLFIIFSLFPFCHT